MAAGATVRGAAATVEVVTWLVNVMVDDRVEPDDCRPLRGRAAGLRLSFLFEFEELLELLLFRFFPAMVNLV